MTPQLAMQACQDDEALDVLVDQLIEAGWIDSDSEDQRWMRDFALSWAQGTARALFLVHWSTEPAFPNSPRLVDPEDFWNPQRMFVGVNREADPLRLAGMRVSYTTIEDRLRDIQRMIDRDIISQEQAMRLMDVPEMEVEDQIINITTNQIRRR
jgi:hypothetical protein